MKRNANLLATFQYLKSLLGGGEKQQKRTLIIALILVEFLLIICAYISYNNKNLDKYIFNSKDLKSSGLFAIMLEDSDGNYKQSTKDEFPGYEYFYNQTKSGCMNSSGKTIPDSLLYDQENKKATVKLNSSGMCYLYFNKYKTDNFASKLIDSGNLWDSGLEGDGYRFTGTGITCSYDDGKYVIAADNQQTTPSCPKRYNYTRTTISDGTTTDYTYQTSCPTDTTTYTYSCTELNGETSSKNIPSNFVCFGTTDVSECTANQDKYMYRIIGVFTDSSEKQHVKLIKYTSIGSYQWHSDGSETVTWKNTDLYSGLNGSYFLTNTAYDYIQNTTWLNKIENWTWNALLTNVGENEGDNDNPDLVGSTIKGVYFSEMNINSSEKLCGNYNGEKITCNNGLLTTPTGKIGLMYVSDMLLSYGPENTETSKHSQLNTTWLNANSNIGKISDWSISQDGFYPDDDSYVYYFDYDGSPDYGYYTDNYDTRPVFYLTSDVSSSEGSGTIDNPYILGTSSSSSSLKIDVKNAKNVMTATIKKGTGNLTKYCINNKATINDCEWKSITTTTITYTMPEYKKYYIHVIDNQGFIAHAYLNYEAKILSQKLIDTKEMWQSGLEDDGYRYTGTGIICSYDNGFYYKLADNQLSNPSCPTLYNYTTTQGGYSYQDSCPDGTTCTSVNGEVAEDASIPNNYICFGTVSQNECLNNKDKYMYRIIGVFKDASGSNHVKLIKNETLVGVQWTSDTSYVSFGESNIYNEINGDAFMNNTYYDYLQNTKWLNKIENWTWSALDTNNQYYYYFQISDIYLHELNKSSNTNSTGTWTTPVGKIGLMYVSDYALSIGDNAINSALTPSKELLKNSWIHCNLLKDNCMEYTITNYGARIVNNRNLGIYVFTISYNGEVPVNGGTSSSFIYRPVFYLTSDVKSIPEGDGTITNPYMIVE